MEKIPLTRTVFQGSSCDALNPHNHRRYHRESNFKIIVIWFFASLSALASNTHSNAEPVILNPINVTATRSDRSPMQIPNSITQINRYPQQEYQPGATLDEFARNTPGVFFQNQFNFAQDLRIAIRGFGARSPFVVPGIQMRFYGIPQTLPH